MTVYFDNAATTAVCPEAAEAAARAMTEFYGNPSSGHTLGREAARSLRESRERVALALGAQPSEVYFTSGGTEGDNWALRGAARLMRHRRRHIITSAAEHEAVLSTAKALEGEGWEVTYLTPDHTGAVRVDDVLRNLRDDTALVSLMLVNNETGAVTPIREIASLVHSKNPDAIVHTDAVQAFLKTRFSVKNLGVDLLTVSSHKIHGPKGAGALYIRRGLRLPPIITGGGQEGGLRPGTEAMPAIVGFGVAAELGRGRIAESEQRVQNLREHLTVGLKAKFPELLILGGGSPYILSISLPGQRSEVLMNYLDAEGICVSKSSACRRGARSHVLEAMGLEPEIIDGAIRLSFSRYNTEEEADIFIDALRRAADSLRRKL